MAGSVSDPPGLLLELPGTEGLVHVMWPPGFEGWLWILLLVMFGMSHPAAATNWAEEDAHAFINQKATRGLEKAVA